MAMIRHEVLTQPTSILRIYRVASEEATPPFDASCVLEWESRSTVWMKAFKGRLTRDMLRCLLEWLAEAGIRTVRAHRDSAHSLPFARPQADGSLLIEVADLLDRFTRRTTSAWGDLPES